MASDPLVIVRSQRELAALSVSRITFSCSARSTSSASARPGMAGVVTELERYVARAC